MSFAAGWGGEILYKDHFEDGIYKCSKCNNELFDSKAKYKDSSAWPAFTETINADSVFKRDESQNKLKVTCAKCGNDLGYEILGGGPDGKSSFQIFSSSLSFVPA